MRKELFNEVSRAITEVRFAEIELNKKEMARDELKREFLQELLDEVYSEGAFKKLLWKFAVSRNYGMDVCFEEISQDETIKYIKEYSKEIYCFNLDSIKLNDDDSDDEMEGDE